MIAVSGWRELLHCSHFTRAVHTTAVPHSETTICTAITDHHHRHSKKEHRCVPPPSWVTNFPVWLNACIKTHQTFVICVFSAIFNLILDCCLWLRGGVFASRSPTWPLGHPLHSRVVAAPCDRCPRRTVK